VSRVLLRAVGLTGIYLLVLSSLKPGDVLVGGLLGLGVAAALRPLHDARAPTPPLARLRAAAAVAAGTLAETVAGSWRTARFCLGGPAAPGFVEVPRGDRSASQVATWAVLTTEAPDEIVVDVDEERDVLVVHLLHAGDPEAVLARHRRAHERQRKVVP
jgi:multicomponent Na+:H+ antiporter subunit E